MAPFIFTISSAFTGNHKNLQHYTSIIKHMPLYQPLPLPAQMLARMLTLA